MDSLWTGGGPHKTGETRSQDVIKDKRFSPLSSSAPSSHFPLPGRGSSPILMSVSRVIRSGWSYDPCGEAFYDISGRVVSTPL
ncbi:hypothetical protein MLD38_012873 [Melastoma candidum]|uniref:Uncharacterized protein n=1 Tax=Melastoma candidum TaxID=119954 RepID=A0ACB9R764_9MYRT|nr:hypothetical protein MLD38_012873 [Melastoma candidum]